MFESGGPSEPSLPNHSTPAYIEMSIYRAPSRGLDGGAQEGYDALTATESGGADIPDELGEWSDPDGSYKSDLSDNADEIDELGGWAEPDESGELAALDDLDEPDLDEPDERDDHDELDEPAAFDEVVGLDKSDEPDKSAVNGKTDMSVEAGTSGGLKGLNGFHGLDVRDPAVDSYEPDETDKTEKSDLYASTGRIVGATEVPSGAPPDRAVRAAPEEDPERDTELAPAGPRPEPTARPRSDAESAAVEQGREPGVSPLSKAEPAAAELGVLPRSDAEPGVLPRSDAELAAVVPGRELGAWSLPTFAELRWTAEASFTPAVWIAERDRHREVGRLLALVDDLVERLGRLPLVKEDGHLVRRIEELGRTDVRECLRLIGQTLADMAPDLAKVVRPRDAEAWIELLRQSADEVAVRGVPSVVVLPAPDGRIDGRVPRKAVSDVDVRDSKAVMFGVDATLTVVHHCEVTQPVIEIAALVEHEEAGPSWSWWGFTPSLRPVETRATPGFRTRISSCSGVSLGNGNAQNTLVRHRMTSCPVDLAVLLADDRIRTALARCRDESLDPADRGDAKEHLRRIVTKVVGLTDASALIPDEVIARQATDEGQVPALRSKGASLTVLHGVGVAAGWNPRVTGRTTTRVGRFQIR